MLTRICLVVSNVARDQKIVRDHALDVHGGRDAIAALHYDQYLARGHPVDQTSFPQASIHYHLQQILWARLDESHSGLQPVNCLT